MSKVHTLEFRRTSQDEGQLVCASCDYVRAVPLTLNGHIENSGKIIHRGDVTAVHSWSEGHGGLDLKVTLP